MPGGDLTVGQGAPPAVPDDIRYELGSGAQLAALAAAPLPPALRAGASVRSLHRDLYLDTADDSLRRRGVVCRLRLAGDRTELVLRIAAAAAAPLRRAEQVAARVGDRALAVVLAGHSSPARRLRTLVDPSHLSVRLDLEVERWTRAVGRDWLGRPLVELHYDEITLRRNGAARSYHQLCAHRLRGARDAMARVAGVYEREHGLRPAAAGTRERGELALRWLPHAGNGAAPAAARASAADVVSSGAINPELSLLAFQERVLALAEDPSMPLGERLRFLGIVAANLDEFYAVRVAGMRAEAIEPTEEQGGDALTPTERAAAIARRSQTLVARQYRCFRDCAATLGAAGHPLLTWPELTREEGERLRDRLRDELLPALTPLAMTLSPGHPVPRLPDLTLSLAVVIAPAGGGPVQLAELELPNSLPRVMPVGEDAAPRGFVLLEDVLRSNLDTVYPNARLEGAHAFRVTYGRDLAVDEAAADSLLDAMDAATRRAPGAVVRDEVERAMPAMLRELLLGSLRRQPGGAALAAGDLIECDGPLDLRCLADVSPHDAAPSPDAPAWHYPPFRGRRRVPRDQSLIASIAAGDLLVHHPFDRFSATVTRFLREAAADPAVTAIKITLYRTGDPAPVIDALVAAAGRGKHVVAFVELKASYDEGRNVSAARALERAGGHVVYGLAGLKIHAKAALVVRREDGKLRRYVHVGTGNYNARTSLHYTDLSLFSCDEALADDVAELFNALTGSSRPPAGLSRGALVAPHQLLPALVAAIDREAAHARAGRAARIRFKVNGLSDPDIVDALCRAAQDGVPVELVVRGICTLRPGVPGLSAGVRVRSVVGRFLEHSRVYHFANGGDPRYYIGSADLRPRNLRRRVELLVPVRDPAAAATLDRLLTLYFNDPSGWELTPGGDYVRGPGGISAQNTLVAEARPARRPQPPSADPVVG